jgi:hypothetical protein
MRTLLALVLLSVMSARADVIIPGSIKIHIDPQDMSLDAYSTYKEIPGNEGKTREEFIESIRGPAGTPGSGGGPVKQIKFASVGNGATTASSVYSPTGLSVQITPNATANKILVQVDGYAGNSYAQSITRFAIFRKIGTGSFVDLTPTGLTGMGGVRTVDNGYAEPFSFTFQDFPNTTDTVTYELRWNTANGTAYLGQRPDGTHMKYPATMLVTEHE